MEKAHFDCEIKRTHAASSRLRLWHPGAMHTIFIFLAATALFLTQTTIHC